MTSSAIKPRVKVPATAHVGEVINIKTLVRHRMESGERRDEAGEIIPRLIINSFKVLFNEELVFEAAMGTAVSANPYFEFSARVTESGTFTFIWVDDRDESTTLDASIEVS